MTIFNFSAGPAVLPPEVKQQIEAELYNWNDTGCSVMEMSHRSAEFTAMAEENEALLRKLLQVPEDYAVMLIPGGARLQYSMIPMNMSSAEGKAVYAVNGHWGKEAFKEGSRFCRATSVRPVTPETYAEIPAFADVDVPTDADYLHYTSNETLEGVQWHQLPSHNGVRLCCDMTSDLLTKPIDVKQYSLIYASAQKNMGIAGITCVLMRKRDIGCSENLLPTMMNYKTYADTGSFYNTPPVFPWYVMLLVLRWTEAQGGVDAIQKMNQQKSRKLYDYIDSSDFFSNKVQLACRSEINVPFWLADETLNSTFLQESSAVGLKALKGHMAVGGMRASIYNAMPMAGIDSLIAFMQEFERTKG
ncbi:3-phosphoserine/phosphohydroxythreonine transaminase [Marinicella sp. W31]|uniref:3-phosphoserine/phosphohydroxythreonine transaminase n=1 Tax=Marinicella sp. W31 TaxID=3023713 RepID=UPI0037568051